MLQHSCYKLISSFTCLRKAPRIERLNSQQICDGIDGRVRKHDLFRLRYTGAQSPSMLHLQHSCYKLNSSFTCLRKAPRIERLNSQQIRDGIDGRVRKHDLFRLRYTGAQSPSMLHLQHSCYKLNSSFTCLRKAPRIERLLNRYVTGLMAELRNTASSRYGTTVYSLSKV